MSLSEINIREKKFHNKLHSSGSERSESVFYKARVHHKSDTQFTVINENFQLEYCFLAQAFQNLIFLQAILTLRF